MKKIKFSVVVLALFSLFFGAAFFNNLWLTSYQFDLTEGQVYSVSDGTKNILKKIDEPIHLYLYFSQKTSTGLTQIQGYAERVKNLLNTYQQHSQGKIKFKVIDPEPFSKAEDQAASFNLTAAPIGQHGESVYFGLAARNAVGKQDSIGFFDPSREATLEYDISKLLLGLIQTQQPKVTIISDLSIDGQSNPMNPMMAYSQPQPWVFYQQLEQTYQVEKVASSAEELPAETDLLILVQAQNLSDALRYQIDQYLMGGGRVIVFADPYSESGQGSQFIEAGQTYTLLKEWGIKIDLDNVVLDIQNGLEIGSQLGNRVRHPAYLGLTRANIFEQSMITQQLEGINGASFGFIEKPASRSYRLTPLLTSSDTAIVIDRETYAANRDPANLPVSGSKTSKKILAAMIQGSLKSAYRDSEQAKQDSEFIGKQTKAQLMVVADTDLLSDRLWVQRNQLFNQTILTPFADNGSFIANASEFMSGDSALISIRAKGRFRRPFEKVKALQLAAEEKFRQREAALQQELDKTEQRLSELQQSQQQSSLVMSQEQQQAIAEFVEQRNKIRQQLRQVRHQLNQDIETLGSWLKLINIILAPLALTIVLFVLRLLFRRRKLAV